MERKVFVILLALAAATVLLACGLGNSGVVGTWQADLGRNSERLDFFADGKVAASAPGLGISTSGRWARMDDGRIRVTLANSTAMMVFRMVNDRQMVFEDVGATVIYNRIER